jgi:hypothetical protein
MSTPSNLNKSIEQKEIEKKIEEIGKELEEKQKEEEAQKKIEEEAQKKIEEEAQKKIEEEAQKKLEEEAQKKIEEEVQKKLEEEVDVIFDYILDGLQSSLMYVSSFYFFSKVVDFSKRPVMTKDPRAFITPSVLFFDASLTLYKMWRRATGNSIGDVKFIKNEKENCVDIKLTGNKWFYILNCLLFASSTTLPISTSTFINMAVSSRIVIPLSRIANYINMRK